MVISLVLIVSVITCGMAMKDHESMTLPVVAQVIRHDLVFYLSIIIENIDTFSCESN